MIAIGQMFAQLPKEIELLPEDLKSGLMELYKKEKNIRNPNLKHIAQENKSNMIWIKGNRDKSLIKKNKLYGIYGYINGDSAWFSLSDNKVYDFNHELGLFNVFYKDTGVWLAQPYKQWLKDAISRKHDSAWKE